MSTATNPTATKRSFYTDGGTLRPDAPSYIVRRADQELYERTLAGDICYVLTPRQMGKSSLMARTAKRLREDGVQTAVVDLSQIGSEQEEKQSADRWYYAIARRIQRELGIQQKLNAWWQERDDLPALQRLTEFFSDVVLAHTTGPVVIFIDEIDTTIGLPFTDDFFAAVRACHNARATEQEYERLSFVFLGVASPSELMKDTRRTPFNIGQRIDLTDFSLEEAKPLAAGLGGDERQNEEALKRIVYWTGGHPYLTQKLCRMATEDGGGKTDTDIDQLVEKHFLEPGVNHQEYNLNFVRDRLTQHDEHTRELLQTYRRIASGKTVRDDTLSPIHTELKLADLIVPRSNRELYIRNPIYEQVFTADWAKAALPRDRNRLTIAVGVALLIVGFGLGVWYT